ncbi:Uncharacterised protein [Klebsiella variicola]|nr:Uncharacterised protein [Klebsiella variicola]
MEVTEGFHQPGDGGVARRMLELRAGHHRIVGDIGHAAQAADNLQHPLTRGAEPALQHVADHQRPGVDKRVSRFALLDLQLQKGVKGLAGGIFAHPLPDLLFLIVVHGHHQAQYLGDRLDGKTFMRIAGGEVLPVYRTDRNAKLIAADAGQRRNVIRHFTAANQRPDFCQNGFQHCVIDHRRHMQLLAHHRNLVGEYSRRGRRSSGG